MFPLVIIGLISMTYTDSTGKYLIRNYMFRFLFLCPYLRRAFRFALVCPSKNNLWQWWEHLCPVNICLVLFCLTLRVTNYIVCMFICWMIFLIFLNDILNDILIKILSILFDIYCFVFHLWITFFYKLNNIIIIISLFQQHLSLTTFSSIW